MKITNREFAHKDELFRQACESEGVEPTRRQASKFRQKKGRVYAAAKRLTRQNEPMHSA